jgi:hypothetical protein
VKIFGKLRNGLHPATPSDRASDFVVPEWITGESAGFFELARHIILNHHPFIERAGAPFRFQLELL